MTKGTPQRRSHYSAERASSNQRWLKPKLAGIKQNNDHYRNVASGSLWVGQAVGVASSKQQRERADHCFRTDAQRLTVDIEPFKRCTGSYHQHKAAISRDSQMPEWVRHRLASMPASWFCRKAIANSVLTG